MAYKGENVNIWPLIQISKKIFQNSPKINESNQNLFTFGFRIIPGTNC